MLARPDIATLKDAFFEKIHPKNEVTEHTCTRHMFL